MNGSLSYFISSISRKLVLLKKSADINPKDAELIDEILDTDIPQMQDLVKVLRSNANLSLMKYL